MKFENLVLYDSHGDCIVAFDKNVDICFNPQKKNLIEAPAIINACIIDCERIGGYTFINWNATIRGVESIGRFCSIAPNAVIGVSGHPAYGISSSNYFYWRSWNAFDKSEFDRNDAGAYVNKYVLEKKQRSFSNGTVKIGNDVWIGQGAYIMNNITVGDGAIIGTNSLVTKDVEPYTIVGGVPARIIKKRFSDDIIERLLKIRWWNYLPELLNGIDIYSVDHSTLDEIESRIEKNGQPIKNILFEFDARAQSITRIENGHSYLMRDNIIREIKAGVISGEPTFNANTYELQVCGWFLPTSAYDTVEIYASDGSKDMQKSNDDIYLYIGNAKMQVPRFDVATHFPQYGESRSGWIFKDKLKPDFPPKMVKAVCKKNGKTVYTYEKNVTVAE